MCENILILKNSMFVIMQYFTKSTRESETDDRFGFSIFKSIGIRFWLTIFLIVGLIKRSNSSKMHNNSCYAKQQKIQKIYFFSIFSEYVSRVPKVLQKIFFPLPESYFYVYDFEKSENLHVFIQSRLRLANHSKK